MGRPARASDTSTTPGPFAARILSAQARTAAAVRPASQASARS